MKKTKQNKTKQNKNKRRPYNIGPYTLEIDHKQKFDLLKYPKQFNILKYFGIFFQP